MNRPLKHDNDPFAWVDEIRHFGGVHDSRPFTSYLQEKVASKDDRIEYLREQLNYNRKFHRLWRFTAIVALIALAVAMYQLAVAVPCAPM